MRTLVRPGTPFDPPAGTETIRGEVLEEGIVDRALEGRDAVLSALGIKRKTRWNPWSALASPPNLTTRVAMRLVEAMPRLDASRVVVISAAGVGESIRHVHPVLRWMINHSSVAASYEDLKEMEAVFARSGLDWLAVRPTTLVAGPPTGSVQAVDRYGMRSRISRGDVAAWMLDALDAPEPFTERTQMIG